MIAAAVDGIDRQERMSWKETVSWFEVEYSENLDGCLRLAGDEANESHRTSSGNKEWSNIAAKGIRVGDRQRKDRP